MTAHFDWFDYTHRRFTQRKQKGFTSVSFIFVIILISGIIIGGSFFYKSLISKTKENQKYIATTLAPSTYPTPLQTTSAAGNWKVYSAKNGGYSFNYPSDWTPDNEFIKEDHTSKNPNQVIKSESIIFFQGSVPKPDLKNPDKYFTEYGKKIRLSFSRSDATSAAQQNLEQYVKAIAGSRFVSSSKTIIGTRQVIEFHFKQCSALDKDRECLGFYFLQGDSYFNFNIQPPNTDPEVAKEIIQSFQTNK